MTLQPLLEAQPAIQIHAFAAISAFLLGAVVLFRRKGDKLHRLGGRVWVALMLVVALSSFFIHTIRLWGVWSPIHLLSIGTLLSLAYAVRKVRGGDVVAHAAAMRTTYVGALIVAGAFTLAPGRIMNEVAFGRAGSADAAGSGVAASHQGPTIVGIVTLTPLWVWPLLLYVLYAGWKATRDRVVTPWRPLVMPAVAAGLALQELISPGLSLAGLAAFAVGAAGGSVAGLVLGRRRPAERRGDGRLALKGDWVPLLLLLGIFGLRYAIGVALAIHPSLGQDVGFLVASLALSGLFAAMMIALTIAALPAGTVRLAGLAGRAVQPSAGK
ncbi:DUF6622 family protein [Mesorhizobium sp. L-8-3]|uniref:DUF6622 family protein n=1 Tax=Mesorhizobium sp. L-8-3 TaxID=2744522 RepID=UPI001925CEB3|nr:DUF6622 family protein [Mesorhizobium sp. L-8-3]BCH28020.1 hypothetical protein MesoLjLb_78050 [Mesorhizobium sp. L-8-3]